jgi:hypothetical protein
MSLYTSTKSCPPGKTGIYAITNILPIRATSNTASRLEMVARSRTCPLTLQLPGRTGVILVHPQVPSHGVRNPCPQFLQHGTPLMGRLEEQSAADGTLPVLVKRCLPE